MPMTCQHNVAVGAWCRYCGTAVDVDLVRAFALAPTPREPERVLGPMPPVRDPDIEMFEDGEPAIVGACGGCGVAVLVSADGWTRCGCGSQTTLLKDATS